MGLLYAREGFEKVGTNLKVSLSAGENTFSSVQLACIKEGSPNFDFK